MQLQSFDLNSLRNVFGPLKADIRERLLAAYNRPCEETWDDAHSILVQPNLTLWQAVIAVDSTFPRTSARVDLEGKRIHGWPRTPDQELLCKAIFFAAYIYDGRR